MAMLAYLPMQMIHSNYSAAVIGMGTGMTAHHLLADPLLDRLDVIEIEKEMIVLAEKFRPANERAYTDERVNYIIDDAKNYFYSQGTQYDLIISEPSNPWISGVSGLFTQEFYKHVKKFISDEGLFVQWVHNYEFNDELLLSILTALSEFEHFELYSIPHVNEADMLIVASHRPLKNIDVNRVLKNEALQSNLKAWGLSPDVFGAQQFLVSKSSLASVLEFGKPIANSDYYPYLDQHAELAFFAKQTCLLGLRFRAGGRYYQEVYEPERFKRRLSIGYSESYNASLSEQKVNELLEAFTYPVLFSKQAGLERELFHALAALFRHGEYSLNHPLVKKIDETLALHTLEPSLQARISLFHRGALGDSVATIREGIDEVLNGHDASMLPEHHLRTLIVLSYLHGGDETMREIYFKFVASENSSLSLYDKVIFHDLMQKREISFAANPR